MFNDVLTHANMTHWAEMGLIVFFAVFVLTTVWALTRTKDQVQQWSALPLTAGDDYVRPNGANTHD
jgi:cbb3-type cytochrome oxidase subunit 3